jgi:hypothetical protein
VPTQATGFVLNGEMDWRSHFGHNDPKDGRHFGTFLVKLPVGVASHRELADDMARHAVEEVQSVLLTGVGGGYNLTVHPAQNYSVPRGEPEKARNGCHVWFTWSAEGTIGIWL